MTSALPDPRGAKRPARGASLIELMVGLVVCLLISLAAAKSAELFGAIQRQGVAMGGGTTNAISALAAIKEDVAAGGMGFFADGRYRCTNLNLSVGASVVANNTGFFPVQARRVGDNDQLDIVYAHEVAGGAWTELRETTDGASTAVLDSRLPVTAGQQPAVLLARSMGNLASPCLVRTVTASAPPASAARQTLTFGITGSHNTGAFAVAPAFQRHEPVILLGNLNWNRYEVQGTNLVIRRLMNNTTATVLPNVIAFRVQYGVSNVGSNDIASWVDSNDGAWTTINELNAERVKAVRIGAVIRSTQREKECNAVPSDHLDITLFAGTPNPVSITPPGTEWRCFRYRTAEVVAPLRNLVSGTRAINWPSTPSTPVTP